MMLTLYKDKNEPWKTTIIRTWKWNRSFAFKIYPAKKNIWLWRPRYMGHIALGILYLARDNNRVMIGLGAFGRFVAIEFCH